MLNIFLDGKQADITDIEKAFSQLNIKGTALERQLIRRIEKGEYNDENSFIDRFGYKLRYDDMSTGCKAALCVANLPNKVIDLKECGINARDAIVELCKEGNIIIGNVSVTVYIENKKPVEIQIGLYKFTDIDRMNRYIQDEYPFEPDLNAGGAECISIKNTNQK